MSELFQVIRQPEPDTVQMPAVRVTPPPPQMEKLKETMTEVPPTVKRPVGRPRKDESSEKSAGGKNSASSSAASKKPIPVIKVPDFSEWEDFIGTIVLRWVARAFIAVVFRGVDRYEICTPDELDDMELDDEELQAVARPFAHIAVRSGFNTKYGRALMDSRDGIEAVVVMFMWGNRVRRIAKRYKPRHAKHISPSVMEERNSQDVNVSSGEAVPETPRPLYAVANGYRPAGVGYN